MPTQDVSRTSMLSSLLFRLKLSALGDSNKSIVPFIPRPLRFLLFLLLLINSRSFPFNWHIRVFRPVIYLRLRWWTLLLSSKKKKDAWIDSLSPIGRSPFDVRTSYTTWASPDDCDFNWHLSNSSYAKVLDMTRLKFALEWLSTLFRDGGWIALGATHYSFLREIPIGSKYEVRMYFGSWDNKWIYIIGRFVSKGKKVTTDEKTRQRLRDAKEALRPVPASEDSLGVPIPHLHTQDQVDSTPSGTPGSSTPNLPSSNSFDSLWREGPDETLHCIAISQMCFKHGRLTVPPSLALASAGFGIPQEKWGEVKRYRTGRNERGDLPSMRDLLKGKWRDVPEGERWWDEALSDVEGERARRLEVVRKVREGIDGAKNL